MDKYDIAKAKSLRGDIIKTLYELMGERIPAGTLRNLLRYKAHNSERDIRRALDYLKGTGKEFIEIYKNKDDFWASEIKITPLGVNLAEGDKTDAGVELDG